MRRALVLASLLASLMACGTPYSPALPAASDGEANVTGTIDRPSVPTCPAGEPCDPHMVAASLIFTAGPGQQVSTPVRGDGSFALHLAPGHYTIAAAPPALGAELDPSSVRVPKAGTVTLHLHFLDTA